MRTSPASKGGGPQETTPGLANEKRLEGGGGFPAHSPSLLSRSELLGRERLWASLVPAGFMTPGRVRVSGARVAADADPGRHFTGLTRWAARPHGVKDPLTGGKVTRAEVRKEA